jgi:DNA-binding MarR family transcriptional regulator
MAPRRKRNALLSALEHLRTWRVDVAFNDVLAFLYVCENEGITVRELALATALDPSTASRTAARLSGGRDRVTAGGAALILARAGQDDKRARALYLTEVGKAFRDDLEEIIFEANPIMAERGR